MESWVLVVLGVLGAVSTGLIVGLVCVRSIIDVARQVGFLPEPLEQWLDKRESKRVVDILTHLGVYQHRDELQARSLMWRVPLSVGADSTQAELANLLVTMCETGTYAVGISGEVAIRRFINIRGKAALVRQQCHRLAEILTNHIGKLLADPASFGAFDCIVTHRRGSMFLAYEVAALLSMPLLIVDNEAPTTVRVQTAALVVEGIRDNVARALFVDDSTTTGRMIAECHRVLNASHIDLVDALVLFLRKEGQPREQLEGMGVRLHACVEVDDASIDRMMTQHAAE